MNWENVMGGWRNVHNEELHISYSSQNIIRVIRSRMMRWACSTRRRQIITYCSLEDLEEGSPLTRQA